MRAVLCVRIPRIDVWCVLLDPTAFMTINVSKNVQVAIREITILDSVYIRLGRCLLLMPPRTVPSISFSTLTIRHVRSVTRPVKHASDSMRQTAILAQEDALSGCHLNPNLIGIAFLVMLKAECIMVLTENAWKSAEMA